MTTIRNTAFGFIIALCSVAAGCTTGPGGNSSSPNSNAPGSASPATSPSPSGSVRTAVPVTLPVLDALFSDEAFKTNLKTKVGITDDQLAQLQKIASEEVARLRQLNTEGQNAEQSPQGEQSRTRAAEAITGVIGEPKA